METRSECASPSDSDVCLKTAQKWQEERVETGKKTKVSAEGAAACRDSDDDSKTVLERK